VHAGRILGKPCDAADARDMLRAFRNASHETLTGVCLLDLVSGDLETLVDSARVTLGRISDDEIEDYVRSGQWKGKAGGYNLIERQQAGWPIECEGDPTTVMGLPMKRLKTLLHNDRERTKT
jgi:septum formation protein